MIRTLDFVVYKDEFMPVNIKHTLIGNPVTQVNTGLVLLNGPVKINQ